MTYALLDTPLLARDDRKRLTRKARPTLDPIPEASSGDFEIVHRTTWRVEPMKVLDGGKVRVPKGSTFTILRRASTRKVWMSDTPMEIDSMKRAAMHAKGDVLVLGLGLGIFPRLATKATTITIVEREADIAGMVWPHVSDERMSLYLADAKAALDAFAKSGRTFDFIYADIWDGLDAEYLPHVNWYLDRCRALLNPGGEVMAWGYENMVASYTSQGTSLAVDVGRGRLPNDPERRAGARKRWPALSVVLDYMFDALEAGTAPPYQEVEATVEDFARRIVTEPEYLEELSDRTVERVSAEERGLPVPKPRVHPDPDELRDRPKFNPLSAFGLLGL